MSIPLHREEKKERKQAFHRHWLHRLRSQVSTIRPKHQGAIHDLLKASFYAGAEWERSKHEPEQLGGID